MSKCIGTDLADCGQSTSAPGVKARSFIDTSRLGGRSGSPGKERRVLARFNVYVVDCKYQKFEK
jgi:hypothetical protein